MNALRKAYYILRYLGPGFALTRVRLAIAARRGTLPKVYATRPWETLTLESLTQAGTPTSPPEYAAFKRQQGVPFVFPLGQPPRVPPELGSAPAATRTPALSERRQLIADNRAVYFFRTPAPAPIDWYTNALTGQRSASRDIWCRVPDFLPQQGDVRTMWEPARAAWALDLARLHARRTAPDAAEHYWRWVESWMDACPPFIGVQWKCGQEAAVRFIALATGFWALADEPATTPERFAQMTRIAWATGYRIAHHIDYAVSQKNNHAISEAAGLIVIATLFPELRDAPEWRQLGRRVLTQELRRQIYADGSYVQHSLNYQRVMMDGTLLALRLCELAGDPLPRDLYDRLGRCADFMWQMTDPESGQVPNYGNNDGADVLPLTECDFNDHRPTIQAVHYLVHRERRLPRGPWDELPLWLFGDEALTQPEPTAAPLTSSRFDAGGYYTLRRPRTWAMLRCHTYRDRPAQADQLHVDLWWRGVNVLQDAGTYQYFVPDTPALDRYFRSAAAHNVIEIDGRDPWQWVSRFLAFPWPRGRIERFTAEPDGPHIVQATTTLRTADGRPVTHRRRLASFADEAWLIIDELAGTAPCTARLRWHLCDGPYEADAAAGVVRLTTPAGDVHVAVAAAESAATPFHLQRGCETPDGVAGWVSPYYAERLPAPTIIAEASGPLPRRCVTAIAPADIDIADVLGRTDQLRGGGA